MNVFQFQQIVADEELPENVTGAHFPAQEWTECLYHVAGGEETGLVLSSIADKVELLTDEDIDCNACTAERIFNATNH